MDENDIKLIVQGIVYPIVMDAMKTQNATNEKIDEVIMECFAKINKSLINITKQLAFTKSVMINSGLTTQNSYDEYMRKYDELKQKSNSDNNL